MDSVTNSDKITHVNYFRLFSYRVNLNLALTGGEMAPLLPFQPDFRFNGH